MYIFFIFYINTTEINIIPWNCHSLHLSEFYLTNEQKLKFSNQQNSNTYIVQENHINNKDIITITNFNNITNECNNKTNIFPINNNQNYNISFKQKYFLGKEGYFFETDNCLCLTVAHEKFDSHEFSVKLVKCTYNDDQRFQILTNFNSSSSQNQNRIIIKQTNSNDNNILNTCNTSVNESKFLKSVFFNFKFNTAKHKMHFENNFNQKTFNLF